MYELLLVSQSPRRRELLEKAGFSFRVDTVKISEIIEENVNPEALVQQVAEAKAMAYLKENKSLKGHKILLLCADTLVFLDGKPLGKPATPSEAEQFLRLLSGREHLVITGIYLNNLLSNEVLRASASTKVQFKKLTDEEIHRYVETGEPLDKAGGYAVQGEGQVFVERIEGSYSNVVGLPMEKLFELLENKGWEIAL